MTDIKGLKPEHGNEFCVPYDKRVKDIMLNIINYDSMFSQYLVAILLTNSGKKDFTIHCMQCFKDTLLAVEDIARLMKELIDASKSKG